MNNDLFECGKAICRLLGDAAADRPLSQAFPACADEAMLFCESHRLQAMTATLVSTRPEAAATYQPLIDAGMRDVIKQMKNNAVEDALSRRFAEEGIRHTILKGSHTRSFYPSSLPRTSTDFDWQVSSDDVERAQALLLADGWSVKSVGDDERCYEKPPRSRLELHVACEGFTDAQQHAVQAMLDRAEEVAPSRYQFTDNDAYAYAVLHLYKHFLLAGAGVRMFLDVYTIEAHADLDRETVANTLDALGIAPFAARVRDINPLCEVRILTGTYDAEHRGEFFADYDYVADAIDLVSCKLDLICTCLERGIPILSALGTGNKQDPSLLRVSDLAETENDALARVIRKELRARGVLHTEVVWSPEAPMDAIPYEAPDPGRRSVPGSLAWVPSSAGLLMARHIVLRLISFPGVKKNL
ncbi:MAG: nucleotidyltransferase family protein [Clostridia bacterium]|nr:nucleotidyltransferase family protein [Clostridia bacterium]